MALLAATAVLAAGIGIAAWATDALESLELQSVDARFSIRGKQNPNKDIVIVGIDDQSLHDVRTSYPFPRRLHARVIDQLRRAGAKVVAYDIEFVGQTTIDDDNALFLALQRAGNVVLAASQVETGGRVQVLGGNENVRRARAVAATPFFRTQSGEVYRLPYGHRGVREFAVVVAERTNGKRVSPGRFSGDGAWIDFAGPPGTYRVIPFSSVLAGRVPASEFRGKTVIVGATTPLLKDNQATPAGGGKMAGPEINANAIDTILRGFPLGGAAGWVSVVLIGLMGVVAPAGAFWLHGLRWLPVPLVALVAYAVAAQLAFDGGSLVPVTYPLLAFVLGVVGTLAVSYATELRDRRRLRESFARFVPAQVVDEVVAQADDDLRLAGTRREGTVLFCDLRGFTSAAEHLAAEQVIELLNRYLTEMSEAILNHGGTVVSYMGDGIMAVFGAPLEQPDHADRALAAAREMLDTRLSRFNAWARDFGLPEGFRMGIGICSGPVMSGNVGSARRLEYTAVGDTTNTASRLEGMTKDRDTPILIADSTRAWLRKPANDLSEVGDLQLRGRTAVLKAWTLDGRGV